MDPKLAPKIKFERPLVITFLAFMVMAVCFAAANWQLIKNAEVAVGWVEHTRSVLEAIHKIRFQTIQIEYNVQSFRITGDKNYSDQQKLFAALREASVLELRQITADNLGQQNLLVSLRAVLDERIAFATKIQQLRRSAGQAAAETYLMSIPLEKTRNKVYEILSQMEINENALLVERQLQSFRYRKYLMASGVIVTALLALALCAVIYLIRRQFEKEKATQHKLKHQMLTDPLTGLGNRRMMMANLDYEILRSHRYRLPLVFAYIDIDHFKRVNDQYGHIAGDEALIRVATSLKSNLRASDQLARFGGEEFVILFSDTTLETATSILEKLRVSVSQLVIPALKGSVTVSIGLAQWQDNETCESLISCADKALYRAKANGRNQVCVQPAFDHQVDEPTLLRASL